MVRGFAFITTFFLCSSVFPVFMYAQDSTQAKADSLKGIQDTSNVPADKKLKEFKKAFEKLVELEETGEKNKPATDPVLNLSGFVLDETRSRMGRTFYKLFYQQWEAPENASYYTITISEQPTPFRGTQIIITMNYQRLLSFRLQPKYRYIEKVSKQAVSYVYQVLKKQSSIEDQLIF